MQDKLKQQENVTKQVGDKIRNEAQERVCFMLMCYHHAGSKIYKHS